MGGLRRQTHPRPDRLPSTNTLGWWEVAALAAKVAQEKDPDSQKSRRPDDVPVLGQMPVGRSNRPSAQRVLDGATLLIFSEPRFGQAPYGTPSTQRSGKNGRAIHCAGSPTTGIAGCCARTNKRPCYSSAPADNETLRRLVRSPHRHGAGRARFGECEAGRLRVQD